jgi:hypothetical protein
MLLVTLKYGFIDESGTMDDQEIMTVGLIILDGQFASRKIQTSILKALYPKRFAEKKSKRGADKSLMLHYFELEPAQKADVARILAEHNITCHCSYYYHDGKVKTHEERSAIYRSMVRACILSALESHEELDICVARQGAGPEQKSEFLAELRLIPDNCRKKYRKVKFSLGTNAHEGVQLADFYVGATRDYFRSSLLQDGTLATAYQIIEPQVVGDLILESGVLDFAAKARG